MSSASKSNALAIMLRLIFVLMMANILAVSLSQASMKNSKYLSQYVQNKLIQAQTLIETEAYLEADDILANLEKKTSSHYGLALIAQTRGQLAIYLDNHQAALAYFKHAFAKAVLDADRQMQLLHSIAQLHCAIGEWQPCRTNMREWISHDSDKAKANDYLMIAHSSSMLNEWEDVAAPINKAISLHAFAPIAWYQLEVSALIKQENWGDAIQAQVALLERYPEVASEWRRLSVLYLENEDNKNALAAYRLVFENGLLNTANDYLQMATLFLQNGLPFYAAETMEKGLNKAILDADEANLNLHSSAWLQAQEMAKAITSLEQLNSLFPSKQSIRKLSHLYLQERNWVQAKRILESYFDFDDSKNESGKIINEKKSELASMKLMLGITLTKLEQFNAARKTLLGLSDNEHYKQRAQSWLDYINRVSIDQVS